jgi:hypothetical protein
MVLPFAEKSKNNITSKKGGPEPAPNRLIERQTAPVISAVQTQN